MRYHRIELLDVRGRVRLDVRGRVRLAWLPCGNVVLGAEWYWWRSGTGGDVVLVAEWYWE